MDKQSEQGSEPEKKNPTDKRHRPSKQKNVPSTARGKLERKRKTWSKSGAGTNYPRHSAPIPKRWLSEEELSKGSSPATTKFPAQLACAEPHGPAKCEWSRVVPWLAPAARLIWLRAVAASGAQAPVVNVLSRASCSTVKVPLLVVRVHRGSRGPTLRTQDIQPLGCRNGEINCGGTAKESWEEDISRPAAGTSHVIRPLGQQQANFFSFGAEAPALTPGIN